MLEEERIMGIAYKNFWSLNTDEAVVAGLLRNAAAKDVEVLMPLNAQMKGIDLVMVNTHNKNVVTIQVKGSRAYEPTKRDTKRFGVGSASWFFFPRAVVDDACADYFIFLVYVIEESVKDGRRYITPHTVSIPTGKLKKLATANKEPHGKGKYCFFIWINPKTKDAFDFRDRIYSLKGFLDGEGFRRLESELL